MHGKKLIENKQRQMGWSNYNILGKTTYEDPLGVYVTLSRGRGQEQIQLLQDFDDGLFTKHPSEDLRIEEC
jgi:hypothetical protein